ncbi:MAG: hypothetical protein OXC95_08400 [Dehalococcoidia bacterium]|nr:hypothetical protein [Dehalococcoidia bacterium]
MRFVIRQMRPADQSQAEAVWKGLSPYRTRDAEASRRKSLEAMELDDLPPTCEENSVAVVPSGRAGDRVVGKVS